MPMPITVCCDSHSPSFFFTSCIYGNAARWHPLQTLLLQNKTPALCFSCRWLTSWVHFDFCVHYILVHLGVQHFDRTRGKYGHYLVLGSIFQNFPCNGINIFFSSTPKSYLPQPLKAKSKRFTRLHSNKLSSL